MTRSMMAMAAFAALLGGLAQAAPPPGLEYTEQGRRALAEGDPEQAAAQFEQALEVNPFDPVALNNLAVAKAEAGDYNQALALLERAARLAPEDRRIAANLSRLRGWLNSYAQAGMPAPDEAASDRGATAALPPPPPPLWDRSRR